jgi:hypothetical protein
VKIVGFHRLLVVAIAVYTEFLLPYVHNVNMCALSISTLEQLIRYVDRKRHCSTTHSGRNVTMSP